MERKSQKRLTAFLAALPLFLCCTLLQAQQQDSLVRLVSGTSLQLIQKDGRNYRKAVSATFLHNGTYLICDTALWNVDDKIINAEGHVKMIQEGTILTSDRMDYLIDESLVQFRGTLVQLEDEDRNTLRTRHLDYNTRDSVAFFRHGASMRDKDGQIIESTDGSYDSKTGVFTFRGDVDMFTDSIFVKTASLDYYSKPSRVDFNSSIDFWKEGSMLSAASGWYERPVETFFFTGKVHGTTEKQEVWSDSLYYYRGVNDVLLLGNAQVQDSTKKVAAVGGRIFYQDSLSRVTMSRDAAVAMRTERKMQDSTRLETTQIDTIYMGADRFVYETVRKCDVPEDELKASESRLAEMLVDPVTEYRRKAAQEAAQEAAARAAAQAPTGHEKRGKAETPESAAIPPPAPDADEEQAADTVAVVAPPLDSLAAAIPDSTKTGFLLAVGKVKIFREDIQVRCDSLRYTDLDSIARFYIDPVVWNDGNRQYSADSIATLVRGGRPDRSSLMSSAFIAIKETDEYFDQIKSTEMMAYFDSTSALSRFDALGGSAAIFYLEEKDEFATVNTVECKMLSAWFEKGEIDRIYYFDSPKNDAYPIPQLSRENRTLKGFSWRDGERPREKGDITSLKVRPSERSAYARHPRTTFARTNIYFPGYMDEVYATLARLDSLKKLPKPSRSLPELRDTASADPAAPAAEDSLKLASPAADTLAAKADSLVAKSDTLSVSDTTRVLTASEIKKMEREKRRAEKQAAREAKWAELDRRDAEKAAEKERRALERKRDRTRKAIIAQRRQEEKDRAKLEKYIASYEKRYLRRLHRTKAGKKPLKENLPPPAEPAALIKE